MMMRSKGFTIVDLLAVIAIIAITVALVVPAVQRSIELANQASCRANLKGIGTAIAMFKGEDKNAKLPLLWTAGNPEADIFWPNGFKDLDELKTKLIGRESAMQNMWVIIDKGLVTEDAFGCPSDDDYVTREYTDKANRRAHRKSYKVGWRSSAEFSYGLHYPYRITAPDNENYSRLSSPAYMGPHMKGSFVIMADKNPSQNNEPVRSVGPDTPPSNHEDDGEAYLTFGGAVNWKQSTEDSVINGDDIYTIRKENNRIPATPADVDDQYIVRHPALPKK